MSDNKALVIIVLGIISFVTLISIFGNSEMFDSEQTKVAKSKERTMQVEYLWKIDSLRALQKK